MKAILTAIIAVGLLSTAPRAAEIISKTDMWGKDYSLALPRSWDRDFSLPLPRAELDQGRLALP